MSGDRLLWKIFSILSLAVFGLIFGRLFQLQVISHDFYDGLVERQSKVNISFVKDRGLIYDRNGVVLAQNHKKASLYTFGKNIDNPDAFVRSLKANGLKIDRSVSEKLKTSNSFVWIERHMDIGKADAIKKAVPGVEYCFEDSRFYPEGDMLSGVIGYTGVDNQGLAGLEYFAEKSLAGTPIPVNVKKDSRGRLILFDDSALKTKPDSAIYLTVDSKLQAVADRILKVDMIDFQANKAIALAVDIKTGEIILSSEYSRDREDSKKNLATSYLFEPGSIFKAISFGYLIEKGLYKPDAQVDTSKVVTLYGHSIKDVYAYKSLTQQEVFSKSSNIGTVLLMSQVGSESFYNFILRCGLSKKTGIEGVSEEVGMLRDPKSWSGLSRASLSIGQEILVTPIQMVRYYAAIANKGVAVKPKIIHSYIVHDNERLVKYESERVISEVTANTLIGMMYTAVETGTGKNARSDIVKIGGKTGTGQKIDKYTGTYSKTDYVASFAGVFPVDNPTIAMIVIYETPRSSIYGGTTGAVTFRKLAEQIAFHYNLGTDITKVQYANK